MNRADPRARPERHLRRRPRPRRSGARRERLPRGHLQRGLPAHRPRRGGPAQAVPPVLLPRRHPQPRRARDARLDPRGRRARLRARCTPTAPPSTTPTCSSAAWSATARPRPGRWRRAGTPTSSSTPSRDGAVLPILHLNGYKIANPTVLARIPHEELRALLEGYGYAPRFVEGDEPAAMHQLMAATLDEVARARSPRSSAARARGRRRRAPALADDRAAHAEGLDRAQDGRRAARRGDRSAPTRCRSRTSRTKPEHLAQLEAVDALLPAARSCSTSTARCVESWPRWRPRGERRMGANPHANGGAAAARPRDARLPRLRRRGRTRRRQRQRGDARARRLPARDHRPQPSRTSD